MSREVRQDTRGRLAVAIARKSAPSSTPHTATLRVADLPLKGRGIAYGFELAIALSSKMDSE